MFVTSDARYMKYGPYVCIGIVLFVLFILWVFCGGKNYDFVGLAPLSPDTCGSYTGSLYNWGNITPAIGYELITDQIPPDTVCRQELEPIIDNTPVLPPGFIVKRDEDLGGETPIILDQRPDNIISNAASMRRSNATRLPQPGNPTTYNPSDKPGGRFISRGERLCCQTMQRIYGVSFESDWPNWLRNPETGETLELDCFNDELQIAVEYNGEQHYKWPNFTNQSREQFINQVRRDGLKIDLCDRNGVYLITVPYNVPHSRIPDYIMLYLPEMIQKRLQEERTLANISH